MTILSLKITLQAGLDEEPGQFALVIDYEKLDLIWVIHQEMKQSLHILIEQEHRKAALSLINLSKQTPQVNETDLDFFSGTI